MIRSKTYDFNNLNKFMIKNNFNKFFIKFFKSFTYI